MLGKGLFTVLLFAFCISAKGQYNPIGANQFSDELIGRVLFGEVPWSSEDILNPSETGVENGFCARYSNFTINNEIENIQDDNPLNTVYFRYVLRGNSYEISVRGDKCTFGSLPYTRGVKVFVDWNKDYDFDDVGEAVWTSSGVSGSTPEFTTNITIPSYAVTDTVRMRVVYARITPGMMSFLWPRTIPPVFEADLTTYDYGETEDYDLVVLGLIDTVEVINESCPGATDGSIIVVPESTAPDNLEYSITSIMGPWSSDSIFTDLAAGNYTVWVMDPVSGDIESENITITAVSSCFDVDAGVDLFSCEGDQVQLNGEVVSGATYSWTPTAGMINPNTFNPIVSPTFTTTYTFQVDSAGEVATDSVTIYVYPYPVFSISGDQSVCTGGTPTDLSASFIPGATYSWSPSGLLSSPNANQTAFSSSVSQTTTYVVSVDLVGCVSEDSLVVTLNPIPTVSLAAFPIPVCAGESVVLQATPSGTANYFQYQQNVSGVWVDLTSPSMNTINPMVISPVNTNTDFRVRVAEDWPNCSASEYDYINVPVISVTAPPIIHD